MKMTAVAAERRCLQLALQVLLLLALILNVAASGTEVSMGTTLLAAKFRSGLVLAADSRTSSGSYVVNRFTDKIAHVFGKIYLMRSGSAADTQYIAEQLQGRLEAITLQHRRHPSVRKAANICRRMAYANKESFQASLLCAGWDARAGAQLYTVPLGGSIIEETPYALSGSGSSYITGYCDANLSAEMGEEDCIEHCARALCLAMARDGSSGGVIRLAIVTEHGVERRILQPGEDGTLVQIEENRRSLPAT